MTDTQLGELAAMATAVLWTLSTVSWTSAGRRIGSLAVSFLRLLVTTLFLAAYSGLLQGSWLPTGADRQTWLLLGVSGLLGFFLADLCSFRALLLIGPRLTLLVQSLAPPTATIISWCFLGESLTARHWLGLAVTCAGIIWVVLERREAAGSVAPRRHMTSGLLLATTAAVAQAVGMVLARMGIGSYDAVAATFIRVIGAMPGYLLLLSVLGRWPTIFRGLRHREAMRIVVAGSAVGPFLGVTLCMVALRHCPAGVVTTIVNTTPIWVLPLTVLLYGERLSLRAIAGAAVSVAGVALMCWVPAQ